MGACCSGVRCSAALQCATWFFTTIAVLLGTGILGLPVTLVNCGFWPFVVVFTVTLAMQAAVVVIQCDTLEQAAVAFTSTDLHSLGKELMPTYSRVVFDFMLLSNFLSILISYTLAAASAFADVMHVSTSAVITPFVIICSILIITIPRTVTTIVSILTGAKVAVLLLVIGLVGVVARSVALVPSTDWTAFLQPFLVGTVAIGGIAQVMPVMLPPKLTKTKLALFRASILAGLVTCYILNVVWADFVLGVVPQTSVDAAAAGFDTSLEQAANNGEIATVPVTVIIDLYFPQYTWIRWTLAVFVIISIIVSYHAIGIGLRHVLSGMASSIRQQFAPGSCLARPLCTSNSNSRLAFFNQDADPLTFYHLAVFISAFLGVWVVSFANPKGFIFFLETFTSLALNYTCGIATVQLNGAIHLHQHNRHSSLVATQRTPTAATVPHVDNNDEKLPFLAAGLAGSMDAIKARATMPPSWWRLLLALFVFTTFALAIAFDVKHALSSHLSEACTTYAFVVALIVQLRLAGFPLCASVLQRLLGFQRANEWIGKASAAYQPHKVAVLDILNAWCWLLSVGLLTTIVCTSNSHHIAIIVALAYCALFIHTVCSLRATYLSHTSIQRGCQALLVIFGITFAGLGWDSGSVACGVLGSVYACYMLASVAISCLPPASFPLLESESVLANNVPVYVHSSYTMKRGT